MQARGFTLVEATIVVAILAISAAIVIPAVSNITKAELRSTASKLSAVVRRTYDDAALTGQIHRLVFDFEARSVKVETTEEMLNFEEGSNAVAEAGKLSEEVSSLLDVPGELQATLEAKKSDASSDSAGEKSGGAFGALFHVNALGKRSGMASDESFKEGGDALPLAEGVKLMDVWVAGMSEPAAQGKVHLYFFPNGYTQDSIIHLQDDDGGVFSLKVAALTGKTSILGEYLEVPK